MFPLIMFNFFSFFLTCFISLGVDVNEGKAVIENVDQSLEGIGKY